MPLAQNYKDDVSLLESEAASTKTTMDCMNTEPDIYQRIHTNMNRGINFVKYDLFSNHITTTTNNNNMLVDDDLPDVVSMCNVSMDSIELHRVANHHTFYLSSCESGTGIDIQESNISSRHSSSSSFSSLNVDVSTTISSIHTNMFLNVLKRLHCSILRRQKHGRYKRLASSLHLFFKKHHNSSINQFCKSSSSPQLTKINNLISKKTTSHQQLHIIETNEDKHCNIKNNVFNIRRTLLRRVRTSDKTVSEDNNTNTMSSLDLATIPSTVLITDSNSSITPIQQIIPIDIKRVSELFLHKNTFIVYLNN